MQRLATAQQAADWLRARVNGNLRTDHRTLALGDALLAWPGATHDARSNVPMVLASGAAACLVEAAGAVVPGVDVDRVAAFDGLKAASGLIADAFYAHPSRRLRVIAVTGTNGKTSSVWWLAQALSNHALRVPLPCAMVGTLGIGLAQASGANQNAALLTTTGLTTPDAVTLQRHLHGFAGSGVLACAMEASSIGIAEHRLDGTRVVTAVFTNLTQDHLDYHGDMVAYWQAKRRLFDWPGLAAAVVNIDDAAGAQLAAELAERALDLWTVSCQRAARLWARDIGHGSAGLRFELVEGQQCHTVQTAMIGQYNVANLLGVIAAMRSLGVPLDEAVAACRQLAPVPGRMQCLPAPGKPLAVVDYAHTPDALEQAILALRPLALQRGGRLWCVFGCGGDRDARKRPLMGRAAALADQVVLTSDNPRSENPLTIMAQAMPGLVGHGATRQIADRGAAIAFAMSNAEQHDVLLVAGKGHEASQEIAGVDWPFSDQEQVERALAAWHGRQQAPLTGVAA